MSNGSQHHTKQEQNTRRACKRYASITSRIEQFKAQPLHGYHNTTITLNALIASSVAAHVIVEGQMNCGHIVIFRNAKFSEFRRFVGHAILLQSEQFRTLGKLSERTSSVLDMLSGRPNRFHV